MAKKFRVLLADDHPIVREGVRQRFEQTADIVLVEETADGDNTLLLTQKLQPDVLLLDVRMPGLQAAEIARQLHQSCPETQVLVFSGYCEPNEVRELVAAKIAGYVLKTEPPSALLRAIRTVSQGGCWFSQPIVAIMNEAASQHQAAEYVTGYWRCWTGMSSGTQCGTIRCESITYPDGGRWYTDMFTIDPASIGGDSGAPGYRPEANLKASVTGIQSAAISGLSCTSGTDAEFSKWHRVRDYFGLTLVTNG